MRQVVLDTETTGLSWERGNRVVETGWVLRARRVHYLVAPLVADLDSAGHIFGGFCE